MENNLQVYKDKLKKHQLKVTDKRMKMIEILEREDKYLSAKDIQVQMNETFPNISYDTIYRNLHTLTALEILEKRVTDAEMVYKISCSHHHHHHFICERCGDIIVVNHCPVDVWKSELKAANATIHAHKVELYGICGNC